MELSKEEKELIDRRRREAEGMDRLRAYTAHVADERKAQLINANDLIEDILEFCQDEGDPFVIDEDNRMVMELLAWYFTRDPMFESNGMSLDKGIYLYGAPGLGKTRIMNLFRAANQTQAFRIVDCSDIAAAFIKKDGGEQALERYFVDNSTIAHKYGVLTAGYCFDDLGVESEGRHFGNNVNCMERIIEVRYRSRHKLTTHIISNMTADQIEQRYGVRIRERMREMFNLIEFPTSAKSRRK